MSLISPAPVSYTHLDVYKRQAYLNVVIRIDGREKDKLEAIYTLQNGLTTGHVGCMVDDRIANPWAGNNVGVMTIRNGQDAFCNYLSVGNCSAVCLSLLHIYTSTCCPATKSCHSSCIRFHHILYT